MNLDELMIGDWVDNTYHGRIEKWRPENWFQHLNGKMMPMRIIGRDIEPIPLTSEILEKNGFSPNGEECWSCKAGWLIPSEYDKEGVVKSWDTSIIGEKNGFDGIIFYVHQLQHALRICGIEKEIVL